MKEIYTFILLFLFSNSFNFFAQQYYYTFSELKGMEDKSGDTHLFYRLYTFQKSGSIMFGDYIENSIHHFDLEDYFPLQVGNSWTYTGSQDTLYKRTFFIKDSLQIGQFKYFIFGIENSDIDTLRKDANGNIYHLRNGEDLLWLDFSKNDGDVYDYVDFDTFKVTVTKNILAETYIGNLYDCIEFFFNIPQAIDDEIWYVLAPGIGLVKKYGAWSDDVLFYASINNVPVDVHKERENNYSFLLFQNYPNPFNPTTEIKFVIPPVPSGKSSFVNLTVYDVLGREVAILVNEEKHPGSYEVEFSAKSGFASGGNEHNLSSGIYFYVLSIGDKTFSKKMCLIK